MSMSGMGFSKPPKKTDTQIIQESIDKLNKKLTSYSGPDAKLKKYAIGTPEYKAAAKEAAELRKELGLLNTKLAASKRTTVQNALQKAIDSGNTDEANRRREELAAINAITNNPSDPNITGPQFIEGDDLGNGIREAGLIVDTDPDTGESIIRSDSQSWAQANQEHLIWVNKDGTNTKVNINAGVNALQKLILEDAQKQPGGLQSLFDRMLKARLISKQTYDSKSTTSNEFTKGLLYSLREFSKKTVRDYELSGVKVPMTFDEYLDKEFKPEGPKVSYDSVTTTRVTAASDLNRFFMQYLGNGASKEQHDEYYKELRALERKAIRTTTTSGNSQNFAGEFLDDMDKMEVMRKVAGKALEGTDIDTVLKAGAGAAQAVNGVLAYARSYGVNLNNKDALNYVANELKSGQADTKKINAKILAISKSTYSNLSDVLTEDVNLRELSSNFIYNMGKTLEINPDAIDALDPTIQTALKNNGNKGTMNLTDFDKMLRNDARWARTSNAKEEASKYAIEVLKDFGLMA
jgi:hypothetical protein